MQEGSKCNVCLTSHGKFTDNGARRRPAVLLADSIDTGPD